MNEMKVYFKKQILAIKFSKVGTENLQK